ncbi:hypothetical protein FHT86_000868 [Rhizobium sp. BK313]|uniref:hypothetical protein n=1 Tax=Rhizobium sp. BK313 TaxID=2587081 RepID=UPI001060BCE6|nr:hypothetical protein [Rhizobium sp. BK313]MBB3452612.1 hypothetical protein [Rhizobium sp. BK313]
MTDDTQTDTRPAAPVHFEHYCEHAGGCSKWCSHGYEIGRGETCWFCYEQRWLEYLLPKTVLS